MNKHDYKSYMDNITFDTGRHQRLMDTIRAGGRVPAKRWSRAAYGLIAVAACLALVFAATRLLAPQGAGDPTLEGPTPAPGLTTPGVTDPGSAAVLPTPAVSAGSTPGPVVSGDLYVLRPQDPFDGQAHSSPAVLGVEFDSGVARVSARILYPDGWFEKQLTREEMVYLLGGEEAGDVPWMLYWTGFDVTGKAIYDGQGQLWQIQLSGADRANEHNTFTLAIAPGKLPPSCYVDPNQTATELRGVLVYGNSSTSYRWTEQDGESASSHLYEIVLLNSGAGLSFSAVNTDEATAAHLATQAANVFTYEDAVHLDRLLSYDGDIPAWRSESLTLAQAEAEEGYGPYVTHLRQNLPSGFTFESAHRELGQNRDYLTLCWTGYYTSISAQFYNIYDLPNGVMDVSSKEYYDERLYTIPYADSVPHDVMFGGFQNPVFNAADLTLDVIEVRVVYKGDLEAWQSQPESSYRSGLRGNFSVLYPDGVLGKFSFSGATPTEVLAMVSGTGEAASTPTPTPTASLSIRVFGAGGSAADLSDVDTIRALLNAGTWTAGTADCANDYSLQFSSGLWLNYHSDCGTFNDGSGNRSLKLSAADREAVNALLAALDLPTRTAPEGTVDRDTAFNNAAAYHNAKYPELMGYNLLNIKVELDRDDNEYEIEFICGGYEFEYDVNAVTGRVIKEDTDYRGPAPAPTASAGTVDRETAFDNAAAYHNAKYPELMGYNLLNIKVELDRDDNEYEIEFICGGYEFEYDVNAVTGRVIKEDTDYRGPRPTSDPAAAVEVQPCPYADCAIMGRHDHNGVTYCGYAFCERSDCDQTGVHYHGGVCYRGCDLCSEDGCTQSGRHYHGEHCYRGCEPCSVEGCAIMGRHDHNGVTYCGYAFCERSDCDQTGVHYHGGNCYRGCDLCSEDGCTQSGVHYHGGNCYRGHASTSAGNGYQGGHHSDGHH